MERPCDFAPIRKLAGALSFLKKWGGERRANPRRERRPRTFASFAPSAIRGRIDDKLVVGSLRRGECVLGEAHETVVRMIEHAKAAFAGLDRLLVPRFCEESALAAKRFDEDPDLGVAKGAGEVGAKFGEQPSRPVLPGGNERARGGLEEHIAQEVALTIAVQPAVKEPRRRLVPAARVPEAVEAIGRVIRSP